MRDNGGYELIEEGYRTKEFKCPNCHKWTKVFRLTHFTGARSAALRCSQCGKLKAAMYFIERDK